MLPSESVPARLGRTLAALLLVACLTSACDGLLAEDEAPKSIEIGYIDWGEDIAVTYLWAYILEKRGYQVTLTQLQVGGLFQGLADGNVDLFYDVWLPETHASYWQDYKDDVERITRWSDSASLEWAVPEYVDAESIADLRGRAEKFGGTVIGIEPGAGLTKASMQEVFSSYGLADAYTLDTSTTPAMLATLERAINAREPIVVTLWHPHWAYAEYPIKDLRDPENALGGTQGLHVAARQGFSRDFPQVTRWLRNFDLNETQLSSLQELILRDHEGDKLAGAEEWLRRHPRYLDSLGIAESSASPAPSS